MTQDARSKVPKNSFSSSWVRSCAESSVRRCNRAPSIPAITHPRYTRGNAAWCLRRAPFFFWRSRGRPGDCDAHIIVFCGGSAAGRRCLILFCVLGTTLNCPSSFAERRCLERRRGSVHHMVFGCVRAVGCVAARGVVSAGQQRVGGANQKTEEVTTSLKNPHLTGTA